MKLKGVKNKKKIKIIIIGDTNLPKSSPNFIQTFDTPSKRIGLKIVIIKKIKLKHIKI